MRSTEFTVAVHPATRVLVENAPTPSSRRLIVLEASER